MEKRASIGVIAPYWDFWESAIDIDLRGTTTKLTSSCIERIQEQGDILWNVADTDLNDGLREVDVVIVIVPMAVPPQHITAFLGSRPGAIRLIWGAHNSPEITDPFTHETIVSRGATVGASMLSASLNQAGLLHEIVLGHPAAQSVMTRLQLVVAAARIRGACLSVIGEELTGYDFVAAPPEEIDRLGITVVAHPPEEFATRAGAVEFGAVLEYLQSLDSGWHDSTTPEGGEQAARYALALEALMDEDGSVAGAINCHTRALRKNPTGTGVAPCFALGCETSKGRPWSCTGDVNTSLAMLLVSALGHPTFYHEMEAVDATTGEVIFANSGEHDTRFRSTRPLSYRPNPWYPGPNPTPIVSFQIAPGPATVVAVAAINNRFRVIVAEGEFTSRAAQDTGTMSAVFTFANSTGTNGWEKWVRAGAGHHSCATDVHLAHTLSELCALLDLDLAQV